MFGWLVAAVNNEQRKNKRFDNHNPIFGNIESIVAKELLDFLQDSWDIQYSRCVGQKMGSFVITCVTLKIYYVFLEGFSSNWP